MKGSGSKATTIEIEKFSVVKAYCATKGISVRQYVNHLIKDDIMRNADVRTSMLYFKGAASDV